jgi:8-oxo-dGTP diphosphatase
MAASSEKSLPPTPFVVRVGVGVLVKDPSEPHKVFCGIRKGGFGNGTLALPGGHLEMMESWEDCAYREVMEECHLELHKTTIRLGHVTNDPMPDEQRHYVTIFMMAECQTTDPVQTPQNMEPEKCEGWKSYTWQELRALQRDRKLFGSLDRLVRESPKTVTDFINSA